MEYIWIFAGMILAVVYVFDRKVLKFNLDDVLYLLKLLIIGSSLSLVVNLLVGRFPPLLPGSAYSLLFVWWEDVLFSLLLIYYAEKFLPKWAFVITATLSSIVFGLGHLYQGWLVVLLLSFYPYFVSYKFGKKIGYGTIMVMHVVYDLVIFGNLKLLHYFKGLL